MRLRRKLLVSLAVAGGLLLFARLFFFGIYLVDSRSMEPTIHGDPESGERVLVRYGHEWPERFDLVVVRLPGEEVPRVKRVVGLPGEGVRLEEGDLYVEGELLGGDVPRPAPVTIYDDRLALEDYFRSQAEGGIVGWQPTASGWRHDGAPERPVARLEYARRVADHYVDAHGNFVEGSTEVGDLWIGAALDLEQPTSRALLAVATQGDRFIAWIGADDGGKRSVRLLSSPIPGPEVAASDSELMAELELAVVAGPHEWVVGRVDGRVEVWFDGRRVLDQRFGVPRRHPLDLFGEGRSHGPRAWIEVGGGGVALLGLHLWRDLHYTSRGELAVREEFQLGPDELFLLGDNSAASRDSRDFGPIPLSDVIGRPTWVLRPLADARPLEGGVRWVPRVLEER
ncbi:MAG: signal peptidase I [Planctomycetes bacterium]|nr:signal peptidase I [Planctomycetota bacterium]